MDDDAPCRDGQRANPRAFAFDHRFCDVTDRRFLAALVPLDAARRASCPVHEIEVGELVLPSGELILSGRFGEGDAFRYRVPPGAYPVILATDFSQNLLAAIRFSNEPVVSWSAVSGANAEDYGFSAEGGVGCFTSREAVDSFQRAGEVESIHEACVDLLERREQQLYGDLSATASREAASAARIKACQESPSGMLFWNVRGSDGNAIVFRLTSDGFHACHIGMTRSQDPAVLVVPVAIEWEPS